MLKLRIFFFLSIAMAGSASAQFQELNATEVELYELIRDHTTQRRTTMQLDPRLCMIARNHCANMNQHGFYAHVDHLGKYPNDRLRDIGYPAPSWYAAKDNYIESLTLTTVANAAVAMNSWLTSGAHQPHVFGESDFFVEQIMIGVGYVPKNGGTQGYYAFISAHPPVGENWQLPNNFSGLGISRADGDVMLTGLSAKAVCAIYRSTPGVLGGWSLFGCGVADQNGRIKFSQSAGGSFFYRIMWYP